MFTLVKEKCGFFRIKRGQSLKELESGLCAPVRGNLYGGRIIDCSKSYAVYTAKPGDCYRTLAERYGMDAEELKEINGGKPVYPTCKIFLPRDPRSF